MYKKLINKLVVSPLTGLLSDQGGIKFNQLNRFWNVCNMVLNIT